MKLPTASAAASLALFATCTVAAPLPFGLPNTALDAHSMFGVDIGFAAIGLHGRRGYARARREYHLGEGEFEHPPPPTLLDTLTGTTHPHPRRQAAAPGTPAKPSPGLGSLLPAVEAAVAGIPIVGTPIAGVLVGADNAVGVTALLSPKDDPAAAAAATVSASTNVKRQAAPGPPGDGLVGTLGLDGALGVLGLGGLVGTVEQTLGGLPVVGLLVGGLLGAVDGTVGLTALLSPAPVVGA